MERQKYVFFKLKIGKYFILKKVQDSCIFCDNQDDNGLVIFKNKLICNKRKQELIHT